MFGAGISRSHQATILLRKLDFEDFAGVETILKLGADPNEMGIWGKTALHQAVMRGRSLKIFMLLLRYGANVNATRSDGTSVYFLAKRYGRDDIVEELEKHNVNVDIPEHQQLVVDIVNGNRDLAFAMVDSNPDLLQAILKEDPHLLCDLGRTGNGDAIRLALDLGLPITCSDDQGFTALHWAAWHGHIEATKILLEKGAPLEQENNYGGTVIDSAVWGYANSDGLGQNADAIIRLLHGAGANLSKISPFPSGHEISDRVLVELGISR